MFDVVVGSNVKVVNSTPILGGNFIESTVVDLLLLSAFIFLEN